jgi:hypothetical protein
MTSNFSGTARGAECSDRKPDAVLRVSSNPFFGFMIEQIEQGSNANLATWWERRQTQ